MCTYSSASRFIFLPHSECCYSLVQFADWGVYAVFVCGCMWAHADVCMVAVLHDMITSQICGRETEFIAKTECVFIPFFFFFLNSEPTIKQTEWIRNRMAGLKEPLRGIKPMIHVNTLSFHVELCHGNLVTGQATGLSHSIFKNTRIYGQINWVQLHLVLLGWIPPPLFLSFSTSPLSYLLFCKVLSFKQTRSISISSCVSRTECLIYLGTKPGTLLASQKQRFCLITGSVHPDR